MNQATIPVVLDTPQPCGLLNTYTGQSIAGVITKTFEVEGNPWCLVILADSTIERPCGDMRPDTDGTWTAEGMPAYVVIS